MGMIAFIFCPIKDVVYVKLRSFTPGFLAQGAAIVVAAINQFANSIPARASVPCVTAFPIRTFVPGPAIHGIVFSSSLSKEVHGFWCWGMSRIQFGVITPILEKAILVTEYAVCMRAFAAVCLATVRTDDHYSILSLFGCYFRAIANRAFSRTEMQGAASFISGASLGNFFSAHMTGEGYIAAVITPFCIGRGIELLSAVFAYFAVHLAPPAMPIPGNSTGRAARSVAFVGG